MLFQHSMNCFFNIFFIYVVSNSSLNIMKKIQKENIFSTKEFNKEMGKLGYVSPQKFIGDYWKNKKIIERVKRGEYRLLID